MPELPEVEGVRRTLAERVVGCVVRGVRVRRREVVVGPGDPFGGWSRAGEAARAAAVSRSGRARRVTSAMLLGGERIVGVRRWGKVLAIEGAEDVRGGTRGGAGGGAGGAVVVHLGMTGSLVHASAGRRLAKADHVHVEWALADGEGAGAGRVVFRDPRRFGGVWVVRGGMPEVRERHWGTLGPDALESSEAEVVGAVVRGMAGTVRAAKGVLLDQRVLAGVGNIYADEALFEAAVEPDRPGREVGEEAAARVGRAVVGVIRRAVEAGGTTIRDYVDGAGEAGGFTGHAVYGRAGAACVRCGASLASRVIAQRTTVSCPGCQGWWNGEHVES